MSEPKMFYFGPWQQVGHYMRSDDHLPKDSEGYRKLHGFTKSNPWGYEVDGGLCPKGESEGVAAIHHKDGWTALSFWDYTVDTRPGSHSTYLAEGDFNFEQMVQMAMRRFSERWNKMPFMVRLGTPKGAEVKE